MYKDFVEDGILARADLAPQAFTEVEDAGPDGIAPGFVTKAVVGVVEGEATSVSWGGRIADEAACGVDVKSYVGC